jgi:hypothetical protein
MLGCQGTCTSQEKDQISTWLADQCNITDTLARQGAINGTFRDPASTEQSIISLIGKYSGKTGKEVVYIAPIVHKKLHWYEIWAIIILVLTCVATLVGWSALGAIGRKEPPVVEDEDEGKLPK